MSSVEVFDPAVGAWAAGPSLGTARYNHGLAALEGKMYAVGGIDSGEVDLTSVEIFDPSAGSWVAGPPLATARYGLGLAVLDGKLYAMGGRNDDDGILSGVEVFNPAVGRWVAGPSMGTARYSHGAVVLEGKVYVAGGDGYNVNDEDDSTDNSSLSSVEIFDPAVGSWAAAPSLGMAREDLCLAVV